MPFAFNGSRLKLGLITGMFLWTSYVFAQDDTSLLDVVEPLDASDLQSLDDSERFIFKDTPVIVFDFERIIQESAQAKKLEALLAQKRAELIVENEQLYADLEQQEKDLSAEKDILTADEFAKLAFNFDQKVIRIRAQQEEKSENIQALLNEGIASIRFEMNEVLKEIAQELRSVAVFERKQVYLMSNSIDVTDEIIKRMSAETSE